MKILKCSKVMMKQAFTSRYTYCHFDFMMHSFFNSSCEIAQLKCVPLRDRWKNWIVIRASKDWLSKTNDSRNVLIGDWIP